MAKHVACFEQLGAKCSVGCLLNLVPIKFPVKLIACSTGTDILSFCKQTPYLNTNGSRCHILLNNIVCPL